MKVLYLDCFSGISGDMTVGALCDLGVKPSTLEWELAKLEIGDFHMHFERKQRLNVEGIHFSIHEGAVHTHDQDEHEHGHGHEHAHAHGEHGHGHCDHDHDEEGCHHHHEHEEHGHAHAHEHGHHHHHHGEEEHAHEHSAGHTEKSPAAHVHEGGHLPAHDHEHGDEVKGEEEHGHEHAHEHTHAHTHEHEHEGCCHTHEHEHSHAHSHEDGHHHHHHGHAHAHGRSHKEIKALIEKSELSAFVKTHALGIFQRVAVAEGKIHGMSPEEVTFHEVGALDSIADIVCVCVGLEALGVENVYVSSLHDGKGFVDCAHGRFPVPAPATLEILTGIPVGQVDEPFELITPTGAAIVAEFGVHFGLMPRMTIEKIGYGVGTRKLRERPNVLRAVLGELATEA